jgi:hypothetical protein
MMKSFRSKHMIYCLGIFLLNIQNASTQNTGMPWMFYPQKNDFSQTSFCKKYDCTNSKFTTRNKNDVINTHSLFGGLYKENYPFDKVRSSFFEVITRRTKYFANSNYWVYSSELAIDPEVRYGKAMLDDFRKGILIPDLQNLISDFTFAMIGKRYSKTELIFCYKANESDTYYLDEFFKFPRTAPISKLPSGQGVPLYLKVYCNENNLITIALSP